MPFSHIEFHENWGVVSGWGRAVTVRSLTDLEVVGRFIEDSGDFRRAVMLENVTASERRDLVVAIEELGVELREFTKSEKQGIAMRTSGIGNKMIMWGSLGLALPYLFVLRVQGRRSTMLAMTPRLEGEGQVASRVGG